MCNILGLLDTPTSGEYSIDGVSTNGLSSAERTVLRRDKVGFIFQNYNLIGTMTAFENIELPLGYRGIPKRERDGKVSAALESVGLEKREDHLPSELSGGMQKRVSFARAIVTNPNTILYDEPTAGLDPISSTLIEDYIVRLREETNAASIVVTHQMSTITRTADRVIMLYDGKIVFEGTPQELLRQDNPYTKQFVTASLDGPMQMQQ